MGNKLWKATERKIAGMLGGKRIPVNSTDGIKCDVDTGVLGIEVKERKKLPAFITKCMKQAVDNCPDGRVPSIVLHEKGDRYEDAMICFLIKDFLKLEVL